MTLDHIMQVRLKPRIDEMVWEQRQIYIDILLAAYDEVCKFGGISYNHHKFNTVKLYF